jgi:hypothetical protein
MATPHVWKILAMSAAPPGWKALFVVEPELDDDDDDDDTYFLLPLAAWALCSTTHPEFTGRYTFGMVRNAETCAHLDVLSPGAFPTFLAILGPDEHPLEDWADAIEEAREGLYEAATRAWEQEQARRQAVLQGQIPPLETDQEWMADLAAEQVAAEQPQAAPVPAPVPPAPTPTPTPDEGAGDGEGGAASEGG